MIIVEEMNDRDLLELAAKFADCKRTDNSDKTPDHWIFEDPYGIWREWNPLKYDRDAFRLMIKLGVAVEIIADGSTPSRVAVSTVDWNETTLACELFSDHASPEEAVRRSIVYAAAEIARGPQS